MAPAKRPVLAKGPLRGLRVVEHSWREPSVGQEYPRNCPLFVPVGRQPVKEASVGKTTRDWVRRVRIEVCCSRESSQLISVSEIDHVGRKSVDVPRHSAIERDHLAGYRRGSCRDKHCRNARKEHRGCEVQK